MILAGDEFARTQDGNNNAYCQDNETTWLDWGLAQDNASLLAFTRRLTQVRERFPILRGPHFLSGDVGNESEFKDVCWIHPSGREMQPDDWEQHGDRCFAMMVDGRARASDASKNGGDECLLLIFNGSDNAVTFTLPDVAGGQIWQRVLDTGDPNAADMRWGAGQTLETGARSLALLQLDLPHP